MLLRCDVCPRYASLNLAGLYDVDYRTKTFSCSMCGGPAWSCVVEPSKERGMEDYRLDPVAGAERHPKAVERITGAGRRRPRVDHSNGELPGRKIDPRR